MTDKELIQLLKTVNTEKPKEKDRQAFREYLSKNPDAWKVIGDVAVQTREQLLRSIENAGLIETTKHGIWELERQFNYADSPVIERLLIENILNCWVHYHMVEYRYTAIMAGSVTAGEGLYWEKRLSTAQRRYLRAIETLAKVRRMKLPALQVNIGEKQVNVAG